MKVILDIKDDVLEDMQLLADIKQCSLSSLLEDAFTTHIREPKKKLDILFQSHEEEIEQFQDVFKYYFTGLSNDLRNTANPSLPHQVQMAAVIDHIKKDVLSNDRFLVALYQTFQSTR